MNNDTVVAMYKTQGITSHDVVNAVRRITGERRVGHAGTLDPLASGVLVIGIGSEATKQLGAVVAKEKEYLAGVFLGIESATDDEEGEKTTHTQAIPPSEAELLRTLKQFEGTIQQVPPLYSAVKVKGKAAYTYARRGTDLVLEPRTVHVRTLELLTYAWPLVTLRAITGPGVYIRSLARDLGAALGTGGYLASLERTRVGEFTKEKALTLDEFASRYQRP